MSVACALPFLILVCLFVFSIVSGKNISIVSSVPFAASDGKGRVSLVGRTCARRVGTRGARVPQRTRSPRPRSQRTGADNSGPGWHRPRPRWSQWPLPAQRPSGRRVGPRQEPGGPGLWPRSAARRGRPEPASLSRSPTVMVADQRLPRVPAEPGTILRLCALLLGAQETKSKCQEHVNQTRYSVTITSLSGLPGRSTPGAPRAQAQHLRGALAPALGTGRPLCLSSPEVGTWARRKNADLGAVQATGVSPGSWSP